VKHWKPIAGIEQLMKTIIIGLGSSYRADDAIGLKAADELRERLVHCPWVDVVDLWVGGLHLMEAMENYSRAIIIDAVQTGLSQPGTIQRISISDQAGCLHFMNLHDVDFASALELGRLAGLSLPAIISVWGVETADTVSFQEELSEPVARALPNLVDAVMEELMTYMEGA
jgi:hydrogenase maturation protease